MVIPKLLKSDCFGCGVGKAGSGDQPEEEYEEDEAQDDLQGKVKGRSCEQDAKGAQGEDPEGDLQTGALT